MNVNRCREENGNSSKCYFPSQCRVLVTARATSVLLEGNVITLLINKKSDRTICQEQASTAAVVVILSLCFAMRKGGKGLIICLRQCQCSCGQPLCENSNHQLANVLHKTAAVGLNKKARAWQEVLSF